jgi:hypothetical protein
MYRSVTCEKAYTVAPETENRKKDLIGELVMCRLPMATLSPSEVILGSHLSKSSQSRFNNNKKPHLIRLFISRGIKVEQLLQLFDSNF